MTITIDTTGVTICILLLQGGYNYWYYRGEFINIDITGVTGTTAPPSLRTRVGGAAGAPGAGVPHLAVRAPRPGGEQLPGFSCLYVDQQT